MVRSKVSYDDLRTEAIYEIGSQLGSIFYDNIYVNPNTGSDDNDGATAKTAIKTLNKLNSILFNVSRVAVENRATISVHLYPGIYPGLLQIQSARCGIQLMNEEPTTGKVILTGFGHTIHDSTSITLQNISFQPVFTNGSAVIVSSLSRLNFYGCELQGDPNKIVHTNLYVASCNVRLEDTKFLGYTVVPHNHVNSFITGDEVTYADSYAEIVLEQDMYSVNVKSGTKKLPVNNMGGFGLDVSSISKDVLIEEGSNANGNYYKYANGVLECYSTTVAGGPANLNLVGSTSEGLFQTPSKFWLFPHGFVSIPHVTVREVSGVGGTWGTLGGVATTGDRTTFVIVSPVSAGTVPTVSLKAVGRWK